MESLFCKIVVGFLLLATFKTVIYILVQKLLKSESPTKRTKIMNSRANHTSKLFNELLKSKKLDYNSIDSINRILKKYAGNKKFSSNIHLIYSVLKHSVIKNQDLAQIQLILDCARAKAK